MSDETYRTVTALHEHHAYLRARDRAARLFAALEAIPLGKMSTEDLEALIAEIEQQIQAKEQRRREFEQLSVSELQDLLKRAQDELAAHRAEKVAQAQKDKPKPKPIGPTSAPQPTMSNVSKAKEAAPPSGAALAAALEQIAEAVRRGH